MTRAGEPIWILYQPADGSHAEWRRVVPHGVRWGTVPNYAEQWFLDALDVVGWVPRSFALLSIRRFSTAGPSLT